MISGMARKNMGMKTGNHQCIYGTTSKNSTWTVMIDLIALLFSQSDFILRKSPPACSTHTRYFCHMSCSYTDERTIRRIAPIDHNR